MADGTSGNISVAIGDFLASGSNIGHCISADIRMSKGVALETRNKFGGVELLKIQGLETLVSRAMDTTLTGTLCLYSIWYLISLLSSYFD